MRRLIILTLLLGGMQLVLPLGARGHGSQTLLTFGFLVLAAYTAGELATASKLPKIIGYLAAGVVFGASGLGTITYASTDALRPVSSLAIALIAFLAGAELRWQEVRSRMRTILRILFTELGVSFVSLTLVLVLLRHNVPFLRGAEMTQVLAFSILFASIAIVHSPAVTMALLTETKAGGPVARTTLGVVLVSDVVIVLLFSTALALTRSVAPPTGSEAHGLSLATVVWSIGGALLVGAALGGAIALYLRFVRRELFLFAIMVTFFGAEIAAIVHVETLLTLLIAGFVSENLSRFEDGEAIRHAMERSAAPVFVVFFALAGAEMMLSDIAAAWYLVVPIALIRILAIWGGTVLGARWAGAAKEGNLIWMGLVSQAGVALGLAVVVAQAYPVRGAQMRTLFIAVVALNELIGPILFRHALARAGEIIATEGFPDPDPSPRVTTASA